jgi:hypothetical protein
MTKVLKQTDLTGSRINAQVNKQHKQETKMTASHNELLCFNGVNAQVSKS